MLSAPGLQEGQCPNCGALEGLVRLEVWGNRPTCMHCLWREGEGPFCPNFMDREVWEQGRSSRWRPPKRR